MGNNSNKIEKFTENFFNTFYSGYWNDEIQYLISDLSVQESYIVQERIAEKRISRGERAIGYKVGCTSRAIQSQFGLNEPILGRLFWPHIFIDVMEKSLIGKDIPIVR